MNLSEYLPEAALGLALTDCAPHGRGAQASMDGFTACPARPSQGGLRNSHVFFATLGETQYQTQHKPTTMLKITQRLDTPQTAQATLSLPFELRQKSRLRVTLDNGEEAGLILERGHVLRGGDCLRAEDGTVVEIIAAAEHVSTVHANNMLELLKACYHLGNRHVALQVNENWLRYLHDHVLDDMVQSLGLNIVHEQAPFEPESGAYHQHHHHVKNNE